MPGHKPFQARLTGPVSQAQAAQMGATDWPGRGELVEQYGEAVVQRLEGSRATNQISPAPMRWGPILVVGGAAVLVGCVFWKWRR